MHPCLWHPHDDNRCVLAAAALRVQLHRASQQHEAVCTELKAKANRGALCDSQRLCDARACAQSEEAQQLHEQLHELRR